MKLDHTRVKPRRRARAAATLVAACAGLAGLPAVGHAAVLMLGSDLTKPADLVEAHGADAAFWNTSIDGVPGAMPANGQVTFVRVKGSVLDDPRQPRKPDPQFHFQVLHPIGGGRVRVMLSSAPFRLPVVRNDNGSNTQAISGYKPVNLCVRKGDYVDFNDIGGHEWSWGGLDGMHVQVFSRTPNSFVDFYSKNNGTNIGSQWAPQQTHQGEELLMQTKLATGADASDICPGGFQQHIFKGLSIRRETVALRARTRTAKLHVQCPGPTYGRCKGVLVLKAKVNGKLVTLGGSAFLVQPAYTASLEIRVSPQNMKLIKKSGGVTATVTADGRDDPNGDRHAKSNGVPVQKKSTAGTVRINPA
jgi:hypothetical protein